MPPLDRRDLLKGLAGSALAALLPGCGSADRDSAAIIDLPPLPEPPDFDYPRVLPLPFAHGVASGDPLPDRVILWTRLTEAQPSAASHVVRWSVSTSPGMAPVLKSGEQVTHAGRDWTVKVDVTGLAPATTYYYRFEALGRVSITGRTRTAPRTSVGEIRLAVLSCSSWWSSHWSGLGHIADRNDLDLVLHCGDYIYDFVDQDEGVRARGNQHSTAHVDYRDWLNLAEVRRRYALWRSDPNLMRAHQQHPWMIVWDNHDLDPRFGNELPSDIDPTRSTCSLADTVRAFWEWTPSRPVKADGSGEFLLYEDGEYPEPQNPLLMWRKLSYGPMADLYGIDTQLLLQDGAPEADASHLAAGGATLLGRRQFDWLTRELLSSAAGGVRWRIINNQTWIAPWNVPAVIEGVPTRVDLPVRWAGYAEERAQLFGFLRGANAASLRIRNTVVLSGDMHGSWASDLIEDNTLSAGYGAGAPLANTRAGSTPENQAAGFGRASTGNLPGLNRRADSVGVEFAPSSMGRGGADELVARAAPGSAFAAQVAATRAIEEATLAGNQNVQFMEWVDHGYGIVSLNAERALFEFWWQDKLKPDAPDVLGFQMVSWATENLATIPPRYPDQIDDVRLHGLDVAASTGLRSAESAPLDQPVAPR